MSAASEGGLQEIEILRAYVRVDDPEAVKSDLEYSGILERRMLRIREVLSGWMRSLALPPRAIFSVELAFKEATSNCVYHGNLGRSSELRETADHNADIQDMRARRTKNLYARAIEVRVLVQHVCAEQPPMVPSSVELTVTQNEEVTLIDRFCVEMIERIEAIGVPQSIAIVLRDEGEGFDWKNAPDPTDPENVEKASGRGVLLMKSFMNEVRYNEKGNEVTMVKSALFA